MWQLPLSPCRTPAVFGSERAMCTTQASYTKQPAIKLFYGVYLKMQAIWHNFHGRGADVHTIATNPACVCQWV